MRNSHKGRSSDQNVVAEAGGASISGGGGEGTYASIPGSRVREAGPPVPSLIIIVESFHLILGIELTMLRPAMTRDLKSNRRELQGKILSIFAADAPQGRLRDAEKGFFPAVFLIT